eukprot:SAG11_NODE_2949_length_2817_cov_25.570640_2_plen_64_part_00
MILSVSYSAVSLFLPACCYCSFSVSIQSDLVILQHKLVIFGKCFGVGKKNKKVIYIKNEIKNN